MRLRKIGAFLVLLLITFVLASCKSDDIDYSKMVKVTFDLQGGEFKNSSYPVELYFYKNSEGTKIYDPVTVSQALKEEKIIKSSYDFVGWSKVKIEDGETLNPADLWDFKNDKVYDNELTLYACWTKQIKNLYNLCYYNENNERCVLGSYYVKNTEKFSDYLSYVTRLKTIESNNPMTAMIYKEVVGEVEVSKIKFIDKDKNLFDMNKTFEEHFVLNGGNSSDINNKDCSVDVFVEYIKGDFTIVTNYEELSKASNSNIYLLNDIDCNGEELFFRNYKKVFEGNNHKISNFKIKYSDSNADLVDDYIDPSKYALSISLFGDIKEATIKNVEFENVTVDLSTTNSRINFIYLAPISAKSEKSVIENVRMSGTFTITKLPKKIAESQEETLFVEYEKAILNKDSDTSENNVVINIVYNPYVNA